MKRRSKRGGRSKRPSRVNARGHSSGTTIPFALNALMGPGSVGSAPHLNSNDETEIDRIRSAWLTGEWEALAKVGSCAIERHAERPLIALLVAVAQQQLGAHDDARESVRRALNWGCPPRIVAQLLVAGVHNTLGRATSLMPDNNKVKAHFEAAVLSAQNGQESHQPGQVRALREMRRLGLLPQAADVLRTALKDVRESAGGTADTNARIAVLESELDLLSEELSLAHQRRALLNANSDQAASEPGSAEWREALQQRSLSQLGQDLWVLEQTGYKRGGFFVEFGAADGVLLSNSYLLETEFAWSGICAEPNPKMYAQLRRHRRCAVSDACVAGMSGREVDFIFAGAFGGIAEHCAADAHRERRLAYADAGHVGRLTTVSLDDLLQRYDAPRDIDYLSVDTEGSEFEILAAFPFEKWNVRLITVEHNFSAQRESIFELLKSHGYQRTERNWDDWYWRRGT